MFIGQVERGMWQVYNETKATNRWIDQKSWGATWFIGFLDNMKSVVISEMIPLRLDGIFCYVYTTGMVRILCMCIFGVIWDYESVETCYVKNWGCDVIWHQSIWVDDKDCWGYGLHIH